MSDMYVRLSDDRDWHYLGNAVVIEMKGDSQGQMAYYVEIKP